MKILHRLAPLSLWGMALAQAQTPANHSGAPVPTPRQESAPVAAQIPGLTTTGARITSAAQNWGTAQWSERKKYAVPATCAINMTRVFAEAGLPQYKGDSVVAFFNSLQNEIRRTKSGQIVRLPKGDPAGVAKALATINGGRIPPGTVILGCTDPTCTKYGPNEHIAVVGGVKGDTLWSWHNNWLREASFGKNVDRDKLRASWLGPYMVSRRNVDQGFPRQWMQTPWVKTSATPSGGRRATAVVPAIDDLDPNQYYLTVVVPPEIDRELNHPATGR